MNYLKDINEILNIKDIKPKNLAFLLHENCNLKCSYCWEQHDNKKWNKKLTFDEFKKIIDFFAENFWIVSNYKDRPWIKLGGGEAFFYSKELYEMIDYILSYRNIICLPEIIIQTNGTCIPKDFFDKYTEKDVSLGISLDGPRDLHNEQRDNSFDKIPLKQILKFFPNTKVYMTMNKKNIHRIPEAWDFVEKLGFKRKQLTINRYDDCSDIQEELNNLNPLINCKVNFKDNLNPEINYYEMKDVLETIVINPYGNFWICNHPPVNMPDGWGKCGNFEIGVDMQIYQETVQSFLEVFKNDH